LRVLGPGEVQGEEVDRQPLEGGEGGEAGEGG
jgi:hypothetical protein